MARKRIKRNKPYTPQSHTYDYFKPIKSREEIMGDISEYYKKYQYNKDILRIKVNEDKYMKYQRDPNREMYVNEIFERYNILRNDNGRPFNSEQEYGDYLRKNTPYNDEQIELLWKDYTKIKNLVLTGQYEEYRINTFRDSYIKAMKESGLSKSAIDNLKDLSIEQFAELANQRDARKDSNNKWRLPQLGGFDYHTNIDPQAKRDYATMAEQEIRALFEEMGLEWKSLDNSTQVYVDYRELRKATRTRSYNSDVRKAIRMLNRVYNTKLNRPDESKYEDNIGGLVERSVSSMRLTTKSGQQVVKKSKAGNYYIPFVGSTREGSKNRNLLLDIVDILNLSESD